MSDVLDADSVLSILAKRPQPETTRLRQLRPKIKDPPYQVATLVGQFHRKFTLDYRNHFGQPVPDWIWVEHPQTIIDLAKAAVAANALLPEFSPEPPTELQKTYRSVEIALNALVNRMMQSEHGVPSTDYEELQYLRNRLIAVATDPIARSMARHPALTREAGEEMAEAFGF